MPKESKPRKISRLVQDIAAFLTATIVIGTALAAAGKWIVKEVNAATNSRVDVLEQKIDDNQKENKLAILRLELITLMESDPTNVVEIEKVAKSYFSYGGDWYMTSLYSRYAKEYGADTSFVVK